MHSFVKVRPAVAGNIFHNIVFEMDDEALVYFRFNFRRPTASWLYYNNSILSKVV